MTQQTDKRQGKPINLPSISKAGKLWHRKNDKTSGEVPTDLVEEKTLELLSVVVIDREDYDDLVVPHGEIRFSVFRNDELIGTISTWIIGGIDTYHPKDYNNPKQYSRFHSLFDAVCDLLPKQELEVTYRDAKLILIQRFKSAPYYI